MAKLLYQREYKKRREANGGQPLGHFTGQRPSVVFASQKPASARPPDIFRVLDERTPEEIAAAEAEKKQRLKEYHAKWYQQNKERMKAENAAKLAAMTPEERSERNAKRRQKSKEYCKKYGDKNREKRNAEMRRRRQNEREQKIATAV